MAHLSPLCMSGGGAGNDRDLSAQATSASSSAALPRRWPCEESISSALLRRRDLTGNARSTQHKFLCQRSQVERERERKREKEIETGRAVLA